MLPTIILHTLSIHTLKYAKEEEMGKEGGRESGEKDREIVNRCVSVREREVENERNGERENERNGERERE